VCVCVCVCTVEIRLLATALDCVRAIVMLAAKAVAKHAIRVATSRKLSTLVAARAVFYKSVWRASKGRNIPHQSSHDLCVQVKQRVTGWGALSCLEHCGDWRGHGMVSEQHCAVCVCVYCGDPTACHST